MHASLCMIVSISVAVFLKTYFWHLADHELIICQPQQTACIVVIYFNYTASFLSVLILQHQLMLACHVGSQWSDTQAHVLIAQSMSQTEIIRQHVEA